MRSLFYFSLAVGSALASPFRPEANNKPESGLGNDRGVVQHPPYGPPLGTWGCTAGHGYPSVITTTVVLTLTLTTAGSGSATAPYGNSPSSFVDSTSFSPPASSTITTTSTSLVTGTSTVTQTTTFATSSTPLSGIPTISGTGASSSAATKATCSSTLPAPAPTQPGVVSSCAKWVVVKKGDSCYDIAKDNHISLNTFYAWNPPVDKCKQLLAGYAYCVQACKEASSPTLSTPGSGVPTTSSTGAGSSAATQATCSMTASAPAPTQPGVVSGCSKWIVAQEGDTCDIIVARVGNGFTLNTFQVWNPAVLAKCTQLLKGDAYCVEVCGSITSATATYSPLPGPTNCANLPTLTAGPKDKYKAYCGDGSVGAGWPSISDWLDFEYLFEHNKPTMQASCAGWGVPCDSEDEIANIKKAIKAVSGTTKVDARFILAMIMQESSGCVRVITTKYSHANPGLMQSWNGKGSCNGNEAYLGLPGTSPDKVKDDCTYDDIHQMILDGTHGTPGNADSGVQQNLKQTGYSGAQAYYGAAKIYNGGIASFTQYKQQLESGCCTSSYASDIANRLMGWVNAAREFTC